MLSESAPVRQIGDQRNRKRFLLVMVYVVLLMPWIVPAARRTAMATANSPLDWVDEQFQPRHEYDRFCQHFGTADCVIISWPGCMLDEPRLDDFSRVLRESPVFRGETGETLFHHVVSGRELLGAMTLPLWNVPRQVAIDRLSGSLVGPDGETTCVVISFTKAGVDQRSRLVPLIQTAAKQYCGAPREAQHLAGPIMDGYEVDRSTQRTIRQMAPLSSLVVLLLCFLCLDSFTATALVFALSLFCQAVTFALIDFGGGTMTALMSVLAPLIQVLAIAGGLHFINYYFDSRKSGHSPQQAPTQAIRLAWVPCTLSSVTTSIGLGSLAVSGLVAVREFGLYAAFGVLLTVVALLTFLPGFATLCPLNVPLSSTGDRQNGWWRWLSAWIQRRSIAVTSVAILMMIGLGAGMLRLQASVRIETLFAGDSRLIRDYQWIETHVGSLVPIEVVAEFDPSDGDASRQLQTLVRMGESLKQIPKVNAVISPVMFLPIEMGFLDSGSSGPWLQVARDAASQFNLSSIESDGTTRWRVTAYVSALGQNDYVEIMDDVNAALHGMSGVRISVSGLMPLVHDIQQQLLTDLFSSFLLAFGLIAIVMTVVQASVITGLLSMIPNVFPALTLFGLLGWMNRSLDIGTIMTASVAMGIAVDDTLHFLTFYHRSLEGGATRSEAVALAYQHCGRAMIQTTVICGGGLSLFVLSDFVPTAGFAWMSVLLLTAALVGDLILLPAILLSPLGKQTERPTEAARTQRNGSGSGAIRIDPQRSGIAMPIAGHSSRQPIMRETSMKRSQ